MELVFHPKNPTGIFFLYQVLKQREIEEIYKFSVRLGEGFIIIHSSI